MAAKRKAIPSDVKLAVLTEAGYRCAVPTCRVILAIDLHHMVEVSNGGGDVPENLIALCPTCHALFHRGEIDRKSIYTWKAMLVALTRAFDQFALDQLIFLGKPETKSLLVSGDGILSFSRLMAAGLATFSCKAQNGPLAAYSVSLTNPGKQLVMAWLSGDRNKVKKVLGAK
jgi:hypothetical protein